MSGCLCATIRKLISGIYSWTRSASIDDANLSGTATLTATFNTNGTIALSGTAGDTISHDFPTLHWHDGGTVTDIGDSRWMKKTLVSGDATTGTLGTTLTAMSASRTMVIGTVAAENRSGTYLIEIYSNAGGTTKVGEITLTMTATSSTL